MPDYLGASWRRSAAYYGDSIMIAHRRLTCETWASNGLAAYSYRFNTIPAGLPAWLGTTHFLEVAFVFNNKAGLGYSPNPFEGKPQAYLDLSDKMSAAWATFVHDGNPGTFWPRYPKGDGVNYVFDGNVTGQGYVEPDLFRKAGTTLINSGNANIFNR